MWAALPPLDWWPLAWIAPVPWILLVRRPALSGRRAYVTLWAAGFAFWMGVLHWLRLPHWATSFGWVALSFYFAFYLPVFIGLARVAVHRLRVPVVLAAPIVWTGLELARAHLLTGMTMGSLAHTQYRWTQLIQVSDLTGDYGVTFVVALVAASLARILPCGRRTEGVLEATNDVQRDQSAFPLHRGGIRRAASRLGPLLPSAAVLAIVLLYGHVRLAENATTPGLRIALIQGSIDIEFDPKTDIRKPMFDEYFGLSKKAVASNRNVDLVVWPESMFPAALVMLSDDAVRPLDYPGSDAEFRQLPKDGPALLRQVARSLDTPLLVGLNAYDLDARGERCYTSAAYVARDGRLVGRYDKMHLVMFGEYVPFADWWPWLQRLTPLPNSAVPGRKPMAWRLGGIRFAPNICYESVLPHVIRGQINQLATEGNEPDVLINITNDGWFWGSSELDLHFACAVFRAVECRKPFLIAANTGFSAWIDGNGRVLAKGPRHAPNVIVADAHIDARRSWYLAHGDRFAGTCFAACGVFGVCGALGTVAERRRRPRCRSKDGAD
jgi:apolipoprotein N-acyltransferase